MPEILDQDWSCVRKYLSGTPSIPKLWSLDTKALLEQEVSIGKKQYKKHRLRSVTTGPRNRNPHVQLLRASRHFSRRQQLRLGITFPPVESGLLQRARAGLSRPNVQSGLVVVGSVVLPFRACTSIALSLLLPHHGRSLRCQYQSLRHNP